MIFYYAVIYVTLQLLLTTKVITTVANERCQSSPGHHITRSSRTIKEYFTLYDFTSELRIENRRNKLEKA
jgi:hypothetical protein